MREEQWAQPTLQMIPPGSFVLFVPVVLLPLQDVMIQHVVKGCLRLKPHHKQAPIP